jgi:hypothetical protein
MDAGGSCRAIYSPCKIDRIPYGNQVRSSGRGQARAWRFIQQIPKRKRLTGDRQMVPEGGSSYSTNACSLITAVRRLPSIPRMIITAMIGERVRSMTEG